MKLYEIVLLEKINIHPTSQHNIQSCLEDWISNLQHEYIHNNPTFKEVNVVVRNNFKNMIKQLQNQLYPILTQIIEPYYPNNQILDKYHTTNKMDKNKYTGHKLNLRIFDQMTTAYGGVGGKWQPNYTEDTHTLENTISFGISYNHLAVMLHKPTYLIMDFWVATLTHELTHLIQQLKSATQGVNVGHAISSRVDNKRERYLSEPHEIDSFAQQVASNVISQLHTSNDVEVLIRNLQKGIFKLPNKGIFSIAQYDEYKQIFTAPSDNQKVVANRRKVWRLFQTALISKLMRYKEHLIAKSG